MSEVGAEMPRYRCHKEVWALKLREVGAGHAEEKMPAKTRRKLKYFNTNGDMVKKGDLTKPKFVLKSDYEDLLMDAVHLINGLKVFGNDNIHKHDVPNFLARYAAQREAKP